MDTPFCEAWPLTLSLSLVGKVPSLGSLEKGVGVRGGERLKLHFFLFGIFPEARHKIAEVMRPQVSSC